MVEAKASVFMYVETFYQMERLHKTLIYQYPD
jgi:hypothetical protein